MKRLRIFLNRYLKVKVLLKRILGIQRIDDAIKYLEEKIVYGYIASIEKRLSILENKIGPTQSGSALIKFDGPSPNLAIPVSQVATNAQFLEPLYSQWCEKIKTERKFHRKQWEYIYILRCLEINNMIEPGKKGIGFGVGFEPIAPYLAAEGVYSIASDLSLEEAKLQGWVDTNQYTKKLEDLEWFGIAKLDELKKFILFENLDMNDIPPRHLNGTYDFTWSACALEHLGSIQNGLEFILNSLKCLKRGGIAVHTTELNLSSNKDTLETGNTVIFRKKDFEELRDLVEKQGCTMELNFTSGDSRLDEFYDVPPYSEFNHLKLQLSKYITTSFGICIKKN